MCHGGLCRDGTRSVIVECRCSECGSRLYKEYQPCIDRAQPINESNVPTGELNVVCCLCGRGKTTTPAARNIPKGVCRLRYGSLRLDSVHRVQGRIFWVGGARHTSISISLVSTKMYNVEHQLRELQLIRCSLLLGEVFSFVLSPEDTATWSSMLDALDSGVDGEIELPAKGTSLRSPRFAVRAPSSPVWFEAQVPEVGPLQCSNVLVRGENISRYQQERWQSIVSQSIAEVRDSEFPIYELFSVHLLPKLHEYDGDEHPPTSAGTPSEIHAHRPENFHALLTSHHLVSVTKRKLMKGWSSDLHLTGFAKVGYPGLIYAEGDKENVEEFVRNVKAMNWLALRVRFVEQVDAPAQTTNTGDEWVEVQKISEVLELMRQKGRESFITNHGIGSSSSF